MTAIGTGVATGIAAGVAQTPLQAQQVARQRDRAAATQDRVREVNEAFKDHLDSLEEGDESQSPAKLRTDPELPEHQSSDERSKKKKRPGAQSSATDEPTDAAPTDAPAPDDAPLYRHLDVQA